jgi:hypothetical protein
VVGEECCLTRWVWRRPRSKGEVLSKRDLSLRLGEFKNERGQNASNLISENFKGRWLGVKSVMKRVKRET